MVTSEKLITIANNTEKVFNAGYNKALKEIPPGASEEELNAKYQEGYDVGYALGRDVWYQNGIMEGREEGIEAGKQAEYDAFWDEYQQNGTRNFYANAFGGIGWTKDTFNPKYPITLSGLTVADYMFCYFNRISTGDTDDLFDFTKFNDKISFKNCKRLNNTFENARIKNLYCDCSSATTLYTTFSCNNGGNFENLTLKVTPTTTSFTDAFKYMYHITNLIFTNDSTISAKVNFQWSTLLNKASIESIINALSATTSGLTVTLSQTAVSNAFTADEWDALEATKTNWTISLV